jgi:hypothetical protein
MWIYCCVDPNQASERETASALVLLAPGRPVCMDVVRVV